MSRRCSRATLLLAAVLSMLPWPPAQSAPATADGETARALVKFRADTSLVSAKGHSATGAAAARVGALAARLGLPMSAGATVSGFAQVVFATGLTSTELAQRLAQESDVEYAVPDERRRILGAPDDPLYAAGVPGNGPAVGQWYLRAPAGAVQSAIDAEAAWSVTTGHPGVVVAVLDTGVRFDHPDLPRVAAGGNLLPGYDMVSDVDTANDRDGRDPDPSDPGDWLTLNEVTQRSSPFYGCNTVAESSSWHGTEVSGLVGALTGNGIGMASVGRNVRVLPVRALGKCGGYDSDIIAGMRWAAGLNVPGVPANPNPARVLNLSLGAEEACGAAYVDAVAAIDAVGAVVVAAAGNSDGHAVGMPATPS